MGAVIDPAGPASPKAKTERNVLRECRALWIDWRFFLGACFLTGSLLLPHAPWRAIVGGMLLAGVILWVTKMSRRHP